MERAPLIFASLLCAATLAACGSKTDANEKNFTAAMNQYFDRKGELCLGTKHWPVDISEMEMRMAKMSTWSSANQMVVLESVGLVKGEDVQVDAVKTFGKPTGAKLNVKRYVLTDAAKPYERQKEVEQLGLNGRTKETQTALCWGKAALNSIEKWEGPIKFGDYQAVNILYTYKVVGAAPWASKAEVKQAFPSVRQVLDGAQSKKVQHGLHLTNQGWEAAGLDPL
jgi:hypothetical protein